MKLWEIKYKCLSTCDFKKVNYCIAKALLNAYHGKLDKGAEVYLNK
ncbi:MAG: hypothetical protein Q8N72_03825 [Candidatus Omnitrophota bacterium]|nr:hypothetical protein [Candidatus Omnitrophota bacterium]